MNILIPMAGAGSRFTKQGYKTHKPIIPTTLRSTGKKVPMVVAAVADLPVPLLQEDTNLTFIIRNFHEKDGIPAEIKKYHPNAKFITVDQLTNGQASTCLLARNHICTDQPLLISACDNGMDIASNIFLQTTQKADAIIFTFRGNETVCAAPHSYGWVKTIGTKVTEISIKKPISDTPMNDHAIVGTFWFREGKNFVAAAEKMIHKNDRINKEFYVDQVFKYLLEEGLDIRIIEVNRYICWGTPEDYELYENTISYWCNFLQNEQKL